MADIAREMERRKMDIPLLIGGATTSKIHTAVKIAPAYSHPVVHVKDASLAVNVVSNLIAKNEEFVQSVKKDYEQIRNFRFSRNPKNISDWRKRANRTPTDWNTSPVYKPNFTGVKYLMDYPLEGSGNTLTGHFSSLPGKCGNLSPILSDESRAKPPQSF